MTDTLKPCPIDEGHHRYIAMSNRSDPNRMWVQCMDCNTYTPYAVWQSLPRNEKPKPKGPRTKEELVKLYCSIEETNETFSDVKAVVTATREDIAAMVREKIDRSGRTARDNGLLADIADEIERMP